MTLHRSLAVFVFLAATCVAGCEQAGERATDTTVAQQDREARSLALFSLASAGQTHGLAVSLARAQEIARAKSGKVSSWVDVGVLWILLARDRSDPGFYLHAEAAARLALALSPDNASARRLQVSTLLNAHKFRDARSESEALLARDPNDALAHGLLSDALYELGDIEGALRAAEAMLHRNDGLPAHSRRAWLRFIRGDVAGARADHEAALLDSTATAEARAFVAVDAGNLSFWQGDLASAQRAFSIALQQLPDFAQATLGLARVALARGEGTAAIALLKTAWRDRRSLEAGLLLVDALEATQQMEEAALVEREALAHARRADPRSTALWLAQRSQELDEARRIIDVELTVHDDPYTHDVASVVALARHELADARQHSDLALAHGTPDPRLLARAGLIRLAQGDATGRGSLERALALNPAFDLVWAARTRAALTQKTAHVP